jgi:hypothetical protein
VIYDLGLCEKYYPDNSIRKAFPKREARHVIRLRKRGMRTDRRVEVWFWLPDGVDTMSKSGMAGAATVRKIW